MGPIANIVLDGSIIAIFTAILTWFGLSKRMERKYQSLIAAQIHEAANNAAQAIIDERLDEMKKRMIFGNIVLMKLCEKNGISNDEIERMRCSVELNFNNPKR